MTTKENLNWDKITFAAACRENTGRYMCDSGGENGRGWQQPDIAGDAPEIRDWHRGCSATIQTSAFLDRRMDMLRDLQRQWQEWHETQDLGWFESGRAFMLSRGYVLAARDNVYNRENDLSDVFVYEVWQDPETQTSSDWIWDDTAVAVLYIHTGADVRAGYGRPLFCRGNGDYTVPVAYVAEYRAEPVAYPCDSPDVDWEHFHGIDERWQAGYTSWPYGNLEADVEVWHEHTRTRDSVEVTLKTGERVRVIATSPYHD